MSLDQSKSSSSSFSNRSVTADLIGMLAVLLCGAMLPSPGSCPGKGVEKVLKCVAGVWKCAADSCEWMGLVPR